MERLFTAVFPDEAAAEDLAARLADCPARLVPRHRWHVTLCFYGQDDPRSRAEWLAEHLAGQHAPWLRLAGSGRFGAVYFAAVEEPELERPDTTPLRELARACGATKRYRPHLTLTRRAERLGDDPLLGYTGPWFRAAEVAMVASAHGEYTVLERFALHEG